MHNRLLINNSGQDEISHTAFDRFALFRRIQRLGPNLANRRRSREVLWVALGYFAATAGQAVGVRILTGLMSPHEYGELALGVSIALLIQTVIFAPAAQSSTRFFAPAKEQNSLVQYFAAVESLASKTVAVYVAFTLLALALLRNFHLDRWLPLSLAAAAYAIVFGLTTILNGTQNAARQRPVVAWHGGMEAWLRAGYSAGLGIILGATSPTVLCGYFLASLTALLSQWWFYRRLKAKANQEFKAELEPENFTTPKEYERRMFRFGYPLVLLGVLSWTQSSCDRWSLEIFQSSAAVGRYQALYQIAYQPLFLVAGFLTQLVGPILFAKAGDGADTKRLKKVILSNLKIVALILVVTLSAIAVFITMPSRVFSVLLGPRFRQDLEWAPLLIASGGVFAMTQIASLTLLASNATRQLVVPRISTCAINVFASAIGARFWGMGGVIVGNLAVAILTFGWVEFVAIRSIRPNILHVFNR